MDNLDVQFINSLIKASKKTRKYKWRSRNSLLNGNQEHFRPDIIVFKGKKRVGINKNKGRFESDEYFDESGFY